MPDPGVQELRSQRSTERRRFQEGQFGERFRFQAPAVQQVSRPQSSRIQQANDRQAGLLGFLGNIGRSSLARFTGGPAVSPLAVLQPSPFEFVETGSAISDVTEETLLTEVYGPVNPTLQDYTDITAAGVRGAAGDDPTDYELSALSEEQARLLRQELQGEKDSLKEFLREEQTYGWYAQALFDAEQVALFGPGDFIPGDPELSARLRDSMTIGDDTKGLSQDTLDAVSAILTHEDMSQQDKEDKLDYLFDRLDVQANVNRQIIDTSEAIDTLDSIMRLPDPELLGRQGIDAEWVNPIYYDFTVVESAFDHAAVSIERHIVDTLGATAAEDELWALILGGNDELAIPSLLATPTALDSTVYDTMIEQLAEANETTPQKIKEILREGLDVGQEARAIYDGVYDQEVLRGEQLGLAVYRVAREFMQLSERDAATFARSRDLMILVEEWSGGNVNWEGGGNRVGLAGMSRSYVESVFGMPYEDAVARFGKVTVDITAAITWMGELGGVDNAMNSYKNTGTWGE